MTSRMRVCFFQHAQDQSEQYRTYVQDEDRFFANHKQKLKEIYDAQNQKTNTDQMYSIEKKS